jgi:hypothetical protein
MAATTAVFPVASGVPSLSGSYIPIIFAATLLREFYAATVFGAIANTEYEGAIKAAGDTVRIRKLPDIQSRKYVNGQTITFDKPSPSYVELLIDQGYYYGFEVSKVDMAQANVPMVQKWAAHAVHNQKISIDTECLDYIKTLAHASNMGATAGKDSADIDLGTTGAPLGINGSSILDTLIDAETVLDEQNAPDDGRYFVVPSWCKGKVMKSNLANASITGDGTSILRNGRMGQIGKFTIYQSNLLPTTTDGTDKVWYMPFGQKEAVSFASQLVENDVGDNPFGFGKLCKGLQVYGREVVKSEALGIVYGKKAAEA